MNNIELENGFVLLQEIKPETKTQSGIYLIPPKWNRKFKVLKSNSDIVDEGDEVFVEIGKGTEILIDKKEYQIYNENHIMAKIN